MLFAAVLCSLLDRQQLRPSQPNPDANYDVASERTFGGMVTRTAHSVAGTMYFTLKTADADMEVQLGPRDFIEKSEFKLKLGEMVTVIGVPSTLRDRQVVLAREIRCQQRRIRCSRSKWRPHVGCRQADSDGPRPCRVGVV